MVSPISEMVLSKGVANVDFSKLSPAMRTQVCDEVGDVLMKRGAHEEAARALSIGANPKLQEYANYFLTHGLPGAAAAYARYCEDGVYVEKVAYANLHSGNKEEAKRLFAKLGNAEMTGFIEENF